MRRRFGTNNFCNPRIGHVPNVKAIERRRAAFVFLLRNNEVLLVRHTKSSKNPPDTYSIPGGRIETGEDPKDAAAREVFEETGLTVHTSDLQHLGTRTEVIETNVGMETWNGELYLCKRFKGEVRMMEAAEEPGWASINDVLEGKYRMPKMSREYSAFLLKTLREQI